MQFIEGRGFKIHLEPGIRHIFPGVVHLFDSDNREIAFQATGIPDLIELLRKVKKVAQDPERR